jgi:putative ATPase
MKGMGYGEGYAHAHQSDAGLSAMECMPDKLIGIRFYEPTSRGIEVRIRDRMEEIRKWKEQQRQSKAESE